VAPASLAFHTPVLLMVADQDKTIGEKRSKMFLQIYKMWPARKWLVEFKDAGHFTFSEMHRIDPNHGDGVGKGKRFDGSEFTYWDSLDVQQYIKAYELAFFDAVLKGDQKALKLLNGPPLNPNIRTEHSEEQPKQVADK
jgi:predicted dienelactone hydrolase